ncbi:MAG: right-handed parallel beta-helix repeat-containing protein [Deltaproteobacteria bacterium]|nr:right-handed parallel beta-helix repeat-containing protein [Deltaproteobacteria bacterium]
MRSGIVFLKLAILPVLVLIAAVFPLQAEGREVVVRPGSSIQAALDAARPGDVISLASGTYAENVVIKVSNITLKAATNGEATMSSNNQSLAVVRVSGANGVRVRGLTLIGPAKAALLIENSKAVMVKDVTAMGAVSGIHLDGSSGSILYGNTLRENNTGIYLHRSFDNKVIKNIADNNAEKGAFLLYSDSNVFIMNSFSYNVWDGINILVARSNTFVSNVVVNNTYPIVDNNPGENLFDSNRTLRRIYFVLPVVLIYMGVVLYLVEKRIFIYYQDRIKRVP